MNGIICVYKEKGYTSFDVVAIMRRICGTKKIGHGGTLDPMAEGVLPIFVGNATKAVDFCPDSTKEYKAGFRFGITTDTQDITGKVLTQNDEYVSRNKMYIIESKFTGNIMQTPPMYSAVQVGGKRLYDLAREGIEVEREARPITIYKLNIDSYDNNQGIMTVRCSKGTYIRTLIHDIGQELGVGAVMTGLQRTKSGVFTLKDCHTLDELKALAEKGSENIEKLLMPISKLYEETPKAFLDEIQTRMFKNGITLDANRVKFERIYGGEYGIVSNDGKLLALGHISPEHDLAVNQRFKEDTAEAPVQKGKRDLSELKEVKF